MPEGIETMAEQDAALSDRTYRVRLQNGRLAEVNCFNFNCARDGDYFGEHDNYVQLTDGGWISYRRLTIQAPPSAPRAS